MFLLKIGFLFLLALPARAENFDCTLADRSTQSNDPDFRLPTPVHATFTTDGQAVTFSNPTAPNILNGTLTYDHLNNSHLIFASTGSEGLTRQADILALSVESFYMKASGEDSASVGADTIRRWSGDYGCRRIKK